MRSTASESSGAALIVNLSTSKPNPASGKQPSDKTGKKPQEEDKSYQRFFLALAALRWAGKERHCAAALRLIDTIRPLVLLSSLAGFVLGAVGVFMGSEKLSLWAWLTISAPVLRLATFDVRVLLRFLASFEAFFVVVNWLSLTISLFYLLPTPGGMAFAFAYSSSIFAVVFNDAALDGLDKQVYGTGNAVWATLMVMGGLRYRRFPLADYSGSLFGGFTTPLENAMNRGGTLCFFFAKYTWLLVYRQPYFSVIGSRVSRTDVAFILQGNQADTITTSSSTTSTQTETRTETDAEAGATRTVTTISTVTTITTTTVKAGGVGPSLFDLASPRGAILAKHDLWSLLVDKAVKQLGCKYTTVADGRSMKGAGQTQLDPRVVEARSAGAGAVETLVLVLFLFGWLLGTLGGVGLLSPGCMALAGLGLFRSLGHLFSLDYRVARRLLASSFEIAFCLVNLLLTSVGLFFTMPPGLPGRVYAFEASVALLDKIMVDAQMSDPVRIRTSSTIGVVLSLAIVILTWQGAFAGGRCEATVLGLFRASRLVTACGFLVAVFLVKNAIVLAFHPNTFVALKRRVRRSDIASFPDSFRDAYLSHQKLPRVCPHECTAERRHKAAVGQPNP